MATFKVTDKTTVAELKQEFKQQIGGLLRVYNGRSEAPDDATLVSIGANSGGVECRSSRTVGKFEEAFMTELNLKVKVYTKDNWVKVLDGITLATVKDLPNGMTKAKMEEYLGYKRDDNEDVKTETSSNKVSDYPTYKEMVEKYPVSDTGDRYEISEDGKRMFNISDSIEGPLVVPEGVEIIEFSRNQRLEEVTAIIMPDSVREMTGEVSWRNCDNLQEIRLSPNLKLNDECFSNLQFESLTLPEGIEVIPNKAFRYSYLKSIKLPSTLKFICTDAFEGSDLEDVVIPAGVKVIFSGAFDTRELKSVTFESADTKVLPYAFPEPYDNETAFSHLYIGRELTDEAYGQDEIVYKDVEKKDWKGNVTGVEHQLTYIPPYFCGPLTVEEGTQKVVPDLQDFSGITEFAYSSDIGYFSFPKNVRKISVPDSVKNLRLNNLRSLVSFNWPKEIRIIDICYAPVRTLAVPEGVKTVQISDMPELEHLTLSQTVECLQVKKCPKLQNFDIPASVSEFMNYCLSECPAITEISIPGNVREIPECFAEECLIAEIHIPDGVEEIKDCAFRNCPNLKKIIIPSSVTRIEKDAFSNCLNLEEVVMEGSPLVFPGAFRNVPGYNGPFIELTTTERTEDGLPLVKLFIDQVYVRMDDYDEINEYICDRCSFGSCALMASDSADQDNYPLDKIGYFICYGSCDDNLNEFYSMEQDDFYAHTNGGWLMLAHPQDDDTMDYGDDIMQKTARGLAVILHPSSGETEEKYPYNGPEAIFELAVRNLDSEEILHTYRYRVFNKDGEWTSEKI